MSTFTYSNNPILAFNSHTLYVMDLLTLTRMSHIAIKYRFEINVDRKEEISLILQLLFVIVIWLSETDNQYLNK